MERCKELPGELWDSILNRLTLDDDEYGHLQSPSLVCKQFFSITNRLRRKLVAHSYLFYSNKCEGLSRALDRFKYLKEMDFVGVFPGSDIDYLLLKIAFSAWDLQSLCFRRFPISPSADTFRRLGSTMKNLKVLRCSDFESLRDPDLVHIADALPRLEELDIRHPRNGFGEQNIRYPELSNRMVTDAGIEAISRKLTELRRIYICGNRSCSDRSLVALSSNCMLLNEIACSSCDITRRGIEWALCHSSSLTSLKAGFYRPSRNSDFNFDDLKIHATGLRELDIVGDDDSERLLCSIAKAGIQLEKLKLFYLSSFFIRRVATLLRACPTLKHFEVHCALIRISDNAMKDLCRCLPNIVSIKVRGSLPASIFLVLAKKCPELSEITLNIESSGQIQYDLGMNLGRNYRIRYLDLGNSWRLNDKLLKDIVVSCPSLHTLKVEGCVQLTKKGLEEILRSCPQIKHLKSDRIREDPSKNIRSQLAKSESILVDRIRSNQQRMIKRMT